jgi:hypothetical protein
MMQCIMAAKKKTNVVDLHMPLLHGFVERRRHAVVSSFLEPDIFVFCSLWHDEKILKARSKYVHVYAAFFIFIQMNGFLFSSTLNMKIKNAA